MDDEDHTYKPKEEWEEIIGFKMEDAYAWADALIDKTTAFEMKGQQADDNGEKRDNDLHVVRIYNITHALSLSLSLSLSIKAL